jgi:RNA polymerase sigma-70 factor (ECF subfamily)
VDDVSEAAFREHYGRIYRYVRRRTETHEQAEDLAQSVFVAAAEHLSRAQLDEAPTLSWLFTVAERRLIDEARRRERRGPDVPLAEAATPAHADGYGGRVASALREALRRLPDGQREVVVMRLLEGRPFAGIAAQVGTSEAACKMRFARALSTVRDQLKQEGIEP